MSSSLVPERPLLISPTLAATIGLDEAVMLHVISELVIQHPAIYSEQRRWAELEPSTFSHALPFWSTEHQQTVEESLKEKGLIQVKTIANNKAGYLYAINQINTDDQSQTLSQTQSMIQAPIAVLNATSEPTNQQTAIEKPNNVFNNPTSSGKASIIRSDWQPSDSLFQQCQQHNISPEFAQQRVKGFVMYWRDRQKAQYSWHHTFLKYLIKEWRQEQSYKGAKELESNMSAQWRPSGDAFSILEHADINLSFIEDAIPEFVLYWRERGLVTSTWNTKFIAHIRRQWGKFNLALENDNTPRLLPSDYEPSEACYDVLALANIDLNFAQDQIKEFILYWQDSKEIYSSWNTKFLQHIKYKWANQHQSSLPMSKQIETTIERFTDRSWAE